MYRLTLNAQSDPEIHLFNKPIILLGSGPDVDLLLSEVDIQPIHLKILEKNGFPILINTTNDPFVSVNGLPFGKKLLNSGDVIIVHQITILFENLNLLTENKKGREEILASILEEKMRKQEEQSQQKKLASLTPLESTNLTPFSLPFEKEVDILQDEELQKASVDQYLKEIELIQKESKLLNSSISNLVEEKKPEKGASLKDDYLRDLEDDNHVESTFKTESSHLYQAWKRILLFIFSLIALSAFTGLIIYINASDKSEAQETKAAQGVADLAMALTHAQLSHIKPHNHNWSDVDFLKTNLQAILPDTFSYANQIDAQGQFHCCPYNLRIYTSSDLSHFLLIAQPTPNLLYWLFPKSIIVVDSHLMELRAVKDVRSLNRLLANSDPLEGLNGKEITQLVKNGELIRLFNLAKESGHNDFTPPKNLAVIHPEAENFIYNAPRYFRLGKNLLQKAINLSTSKGSSQEVTILKQDVENYKWLDHFILYSDKGKKYALLARKSFSLFAPSEQLLFGYLQFNAEGKINHGFLLKDENKNKELTLADSANPQQEEIAFQAKSEIDVEDSSKIKKIENPKIDKNHPIYIQLKSLVAEREKDLKPLITALNALMNQEFQMPRPSFQIEFQNLSHTYLMADVKHKKALKESLDTLYQQYEDIPIHQFIAYLKEFKLEQLIQQEDQSLTLVDENCQQNMNDLINKIKNSKSLAELDNVVHIAITWLNFDCIKDPEELVRYQNLLRNQLLEQLENYLLSQKSNIILKPDDSETLNNILSQERLIKSEEKDFFLDEFEELIASQQTQLEEKVESDKEEEKTEAELPSEDKKIEEKN